MKIIYGAQDAIDAQRVVDLLAYEGFTANVLGGYLTGAMGELPMSGLVNVWVADEDEARAHALLAAADHAPGLPDEPEADDAPDVAPAKGSGAGLLVFLALLLLGGAVGTLVASGPPQEPEETR